MAEWADVDTIESYEDAVQVVLEGINMRVDPRMVLWCDYPVLGLDCDELHEKVRKDTRNLDKEVTEITEGQVTSLDITQLWYVGVPKFKLVRRGVPHVTFEIGLYYAATDTDGEDYDWCWYGKLLANADTFDFPLSLAAPLVHALKNGQMETSEAHVVERVPGYTVYGFMGGEWKAPDAFLGFLWALAEKRKNFEGLLDPASCSLAAKMAKELPSPELPRLVSGDDYQAIVTGLKESMGFSKAKAEEAARYAMEKVPNEPLGDKIKEALKFLGA